MPVKRVRGGLPKPDPEGGAIVLPRDMDLAPARRRLFPVMARFCRNNRAMFALVLRPNPLMAGHTPHQPLPRFIPGANSCLA